jgi:galactokinase
MEVNLALAAYKIVHSATHDLPDVEAFIATLNALDSNPQPEARKLFETNEELFVARAPGRLDVMGGIADYSGSLVLQLPIAEATLVALQLDASRELRIVSLTDDATREASFSMPLTDFEQNGEVVEYEVARNRFLTDVRHHWAAYVAGVFLVLMRERGVRFERGARFLISSSVPEGKGVGSSSAIEVAVMSAVAAAFDLQLAAREIALLCQVVENKVVGAPCGVMDQMTAACGESDRLLSLLCQPAELLGAIPLPDDLRVWGLDSGVRHSVGAGDYGSVRTGAFMGYRIIAEQAGLQVLPENPESQTLKIVDEKWHGYLANLTPSEFEQQFAPKLADRMTGGEFLRTYGGITDTVTRVDPERPYAVRRPTAHAIYENFRVRAFAELLHAPPNERRRELLGEVMFQSHASYSACGLGSEGTDLLVELIRRAGPAHGLYGARITGGGSGGTVALLGRRDAEASVLAIAREYERASKNRCAVFSGSSPGSSAFGYLKLRKEGSEAFTKKINELRGRK